MWTSLKNRIQACGGKMNRNKAIKLNVFKFGSKYIYTRICQANFWKGKLSEAIISDMKSIDKTIGDLNLLGKKTIRNIVTDTKTDDDFKKMELDEFIKICDKKLESSKSAYDFALNQTENSENEMDAEKSKITCEKIKIFCNVLNELKNMATENKNNKE